MAKMAELHAQLAEIPAHCDQCGDLVEICKELEECPGAYTWAESDGCFFCSSSRGCICDDIVDQYKERFL